MNLEFKELPGWHFEVEEVSAGVYKALGKSNLGANIELSGTDPDELLEKCKQYAKVVRLDNQSIK